jgi:hypothetical protein
MTTKPVPYPNDTVPLPLVQVLGEIAARVEREQATTKNQTPKTNAA